MKSRAERSTEKSAYLSNPKDYHSILLAISLLSFMVDTRNVDSRVQYVDAAPRERETSSVINVQYQYQRHRFQRVSRRRLNSVTVSMSRHISSDSAIKARS